MSRGTEKQLKELGWNLIVVWQCELQKDGFLETLPDKRHFTLRVHSSLISAFARKAEGLPIA